MSSRILFALLSLSLAACATPSLNPAGVPAPGEAQAGAEARPTAVTPEAEASREPGRVGVLVMAHGGSEEWNRSVLDAVESLSQQLPTEVAFGMANPLTLDRGMKSLADAGVEKVAVVRMFLSGESFLEQTEYFLGLSPTPPSRFLLMGPARDLGPEPAPLSHDLTVVTHAHGLMQAREAAEIVAARAGEHAVQPELESVLILAHGMGAEDANDRVLDAMGAAEEATARLGFAAVRVATLREDWEEARASAEVEIRDFVASETAAGRRVIVVPYRLSGFGPYAQVLEGLEYTPTEGLLPHPRIGDWIQGTATEIICGQYWVEAPMSCPRTVITTARRP